MNVVPLAAVMAKNAPPAKDAIVAAAAAQPTKRARNAIAAQLRPVRRRYKSKNSPELLPELLIN